jgi:hypothetical protein
MRQRGFASMLLIYAFAALAIVATIGGIYWKLTSDARAEGYAKAKAECEEAARIQREAEIGKANLAATEKEKGDAKAKVIYRTITRTVDKYIDRPVYRDCKLDADGLRDANAALTGALAAPAEPDKRMPQPLPAVGRDARVSAP